MLDTSETIVAIASQPGPAARGLVRLSGPLALTIALDGFEGDDPSPIPRRPVAYPGRLRLDGLSSTRLRASLLLWPGPRSYTGQAVAEIHTVGSPPLLRMLVAHALSRGARLAEPGEFTLRAFLSGRIDLAQSEAVLAVIEATDRGTLEVALDQLAGGLSTPLRDLRDRLLDWLVEIEANLDFVEESDVSPVAREALADDLADAARRLDDLIARLDRRDHAETRPRVVLVGPPNAGKSRLFNALIIGRDQAIVSPVAGTTRDYLVGISDCDGLAIDLFDTAGEEIGATSIAAAAQCQRSAGMARADLILQCTPLDAIVSEPARIDDARTLLVATKADLQGPSRGGRSLVTSAATGEGLDALRSAIAAALRSRRVGAGALQGLGPRSRESLVRGAAAVSHARAIAERSGGEELIAAELRQAVDDLGTIVGAVVTEEILDLIFRRFCIGK